MALRECPLSKQPIAGFMLVSQPTNDLGADDVSFRDSPFAGDLRSSPATSLTAPSTRRPNRTLSFTRTSKGPCSRSSFLVLAQHGLVFFDGREPPTRRRLPTDAHQIPIFVGALVDEFWSVDDLG